MKGKNLSRNNKWGKAEKSNLHYKLYKSGKQWVTASLFMLSLGAVLITAPNRVWADTVSAATAETTESATNSASGEVATSVANASTAEASATAQKQVVEPQTTSSSSTVSSSAASSASDSTAASAASTKQATSTAVSAAADMVSSSSSKAASSANQSSASASDNGTVVSAGSGVPESNATQEAGSAASAASSSARDAQTDTTQKPSAASSTTNSQMIASEQSTKNSASVSSVTSRSTESASDSNPVSKSDQSATSPTAAKTSNKSATVTAAVTYDQKTNTITLPKDATAEQITEAQQKAKTIYTMTAKMPSIVRDGATTTTPTSQSGTNAATFDEKTNTYTIIDPTDAQMTALKATAQQMANKTGKAVTINAVAASSTTAAATTKIDTSSPSYKAGMNDAYADVTKADGSVPDIAAIIDDYNNNSSMQDADGTPAWKNGVIYSQSNSSETIYQVLVVVGGTTNFQGNYYSRVLNDGKVQVPLSKTSTLNGDDYNAGYAAYLKQYAAQVSGYMNQVKNNVQDPDLADKLVNTIAYKNGDLNSKGDWISQAGAALNTIYSWVMKALGQKDPVGSNPDIFNYNTNDWDSSLGIQSPKAVDTASASISTVNNFIGMAISYIQNGIMKQALSDARSIGGLQSGSISLPATLSEALSLNTPLKKIATAFGFGDVINSTIVNQVYTSIAQGIRNDISFNFQQGMDEAISLALNGGTLDSATLARFKTVGYDPSGNTSLATTNTTSPTVSYINKSDQLGGNTTNFVEAVGFDYGKRIAQSIVDMAVKDSTTGAQKTTASDIITQMHQNKIITDTEYNQLTQSNYADDSTLQGYTADASGAQKTILGLYEAEINAIQKAKSDYVSDPTGDFTKSAPSYTNEGSGNVQIYDSKTQQWSTKAPDTVTISDYSNIMDYLQSTNVGSQGQADADSQSHKQADGGVAIIDSTDKTFSAGDRSKLASQQLKDNADAVITSLGVGSTGKTLQAAYVNAYNKEVRLANNAYAAGQLAAQNQTKSDAYKTTNVLPAVTDSTVKVTIDGVTYSATSDGTGSLYKEGTSSGEPSGTAFSDGYNAAAALINNNAISSDQAVAADQAASAAVFAKSASDYYADASSAASAASLAAKDLSAAAEGDSGASSDVKIAVDAASDAAAALQSASAANSNAQSQAALASKAATDAKAAKTASDAKAAANAATSGNGIASGAASDASAAANVAKDAAKRASDAQTTYQHDAAESAAGNTGSDAVTTSSAANETSDAAGSAASAAKDASDAASGAASLASGDSNAASAAKNANDAAQRASAANSAAQAASQAASDANSKAAQAAKDASAAVAKGDKAAAKAASDAASNAASVAKAASDTAAKAGKQASDAASDAKAAANEVAQTGSQRCGQQCSSPRNHSRK